MFASDTTLYTIPMLHLLTIKNFLLRHQASLQDVECGTGSYFVKMVSHLVIRGGTKLTIGKGTVISIQENLYPNGPGSLGTKQPNDLNLIRKHTLNVLKRLSKARIATETIDPIMALTIRSDPNSSKISLALHNSASEPPGLLFYYLFDDWVTSYSLVAKKDHQYGTQLEVLVCISRRSEIATDTLSARRNVPNRLTRSCEYIASLRSPARCTKAHLRIV